MSATRGVIVGGLALTLLQATLSTAQKSTSGGPIADAFTLITKVFVRVVDPTVPLIPDTRSSSDKNSTGPAAYITTPTTPTTPNPTQARPAASGQTYVSA